MLPRHGRSSAVSIPWWELLGADVKMNRIDEKKKKKKNIMAITEITLCGSIDAFTLGNGIIYGRETERTRRVEE